MFKATDSKNLKNLRKKACGLTLSLRKLLADLVKRFRLIPKNIVISAFFLSVSLLLLKFQNERVNRAVLGIKTQTDRQSSTIYEWQQILTERPDYRDGWIQLGSLYYQAGDKEKAKEAIQKAKEIDPNNENVLSFEKFLEY